MAKEIDPFAEFKDWLVDGPAGEWPEPWEAEKELTPEQQTIVKNNAALLLDRDAWKNRVNAFEAAIQALPDGEEQKKERADYHIRFDRFRFEDGEKNFSNFYFPCSVSFVKAQFGEGNVDFSQAQFGEGNVSFYEAQFGEGVVNFREAQFGEGDVDFYKAQFGEGNVNFRDAQFGEGNVDFRDAQFGEGNVNFSQAQFGEGNVSFYEAQFGEGVVNFREAQFGEGDVDFYKAQFGEGNVNFRDAQFGEGNVYFYEAQFGEGVVNFREAQFGEGNVDFSQAQFGEGNVYFYEAQFGEGNVYLTELKLSATTLSASDMVVCHLYVKADFPLEAVFQRLKVTETASFSGCKFEQVPDFRDAKFDRPPDVANMEVSRPKLKKDRFWPFSTAEDPEDAPRLRKLKAMALDASDHERDSYFFAREMLAKRGVETKSWPGLLVNTLYDWLSVYGYSFLRPLGWLTTSLVFFFCIYACVVQDNFGLSSMLCFAVLHSGLNFLPLIGGLFRYAPTPDKYTSPYEKLYAQLPDADITLLVTLGIVQSIIGGILLFLFLLALRNRFRLK